MVDVQQEACQSGLSFRVHLTSDFKEASIYGEEGYVSEWLFIKPMRLLDLGTQLGQRHANLFYKAEKGSYRQPSIIK